MEGRSNSFLETERTGMLMRRYAVPCVISLLVAALYNIVDQIFIANADYLGSYGNAANTVVYPLTVVALAFAVMIGDGCCAFVSISLGAKNASDAHKSIGSAVVMSAGIGIVIMALYLAFMDPIITTFGGRVNDETFALSREYMFWIALGIPFYVFGQAMNPVIRSDGSPKFAMASTLAGAVINLILDPVFIYVMRWGMMGAAVATVLGQVATAALAIWYLCHMKAVKLNKNSFRPHVKLMRRYIPLGICSFLAQISLVCSMAAMQNMLIKYGALDPIYSQVQYAQIPMAVIGIVMKFLQIVISIAIGTAAGCIPIVGYNVGAGRSDRAKLLFKQLLTVEAIVGTIALFIVELFPDKLIALFGAANESSYYTDYAIRAFRVYLCMIVLATVNKATFIYLQSLGKALLSTMLSMVRELVFGVGLSILLPQFFGLDGVLYSMPVADVLTFIISVSCILYTMRLLSKPITRAAT
ncbi:MAG: MATE family efflux transporter [Clostridiales bacterium]|nr:MATE family efflux transporter [Clostridiales bacterium]